MALGDQQGLRVLSTRASEAEAGLPFAAVIDLLDVVTDDELDPLPPPQLHALKVALYREDPIGHRADPQAISLGLLTALRVLAADGPLLVAIDDVQWLDRASDDALTYVVRRLGVDQVTFLLARRPGRRSALEDAFPRDRLRRVIVEPTSLGATRHILAARLGLRLPHHLLRRVYDTTLGNPLFALEVGRVLASQDPGSLGEDVPVPDHVEDLLGLRVTDLEAPVRRVLLALALDADLRVVQLRELSGSEAIERAREEGVVVVEGERVRASHPLLAAAAKRHATADERRDLHRALADTVANEQRRALHLALATPGEDDHLAVRVAAAADLAAARGTPRLAVELGTHAVRLTPTDGPTYTARVLELGQHLAIAGEKQRLTELLGGRVESMPDPDSRVAAYLLSDPGGRAGQRRDPAAPDGGTGRGRRRSAPPGSGARGAGGERGCHHGGRARACRGARRGGRGLARPGPTRRSSPRPRCARLDTGTPRQTGRRPGGEVPSPPRRPIPGLPTPRARRRSAPGVAGRGAGGTRATDLAEEAGRGAGRAVGVRPDPAAPVRAGASRRCLERSATTARRLGSLHRQRAPALADVRALPGAPRRGTR